MTQEELFNSMQRARELCNEDVKVTPEARARYAQSSSQVGGLSASQLDSFFCGDDIPQSQSSSESFSAPIRNIDNYTDSDIENSNLPDFIKESFKKEKIEIKDESSINSVLDKMQKTITPDRKKVSVINEESSPVTAPHPALVSNGVDYSIIRAIVKDCLESYMPKVNLNESASLDSIAINKNGQISFIDTKGNIFTAKLQKTGNINEGKRR